MFPTRHLTSFITLTVLTCTSAALYGSQAQTLAKSDTAPASSLNIEVNTPTQAQVKNNAAQAETRQPFFLGLERYDAFAKTQSDLEKKLKPITTSDANVQDTAIKNLTAATTLLTQLSKKYTALKEHVSALQDFDGFVRLMNSERPAVKNIDKNFTTAQEIVESFKKQLLQQLTNQFNVLANEAATNQSNKAVLKKLLNEDCPALDVLFKQIPNAENLDVYGKLQELQKELDVKIKALERAEEAAAEAARLAKEKEQREAAEAQRLANEVAQREKDRTAAELARQNKLWYKLTHGKYVLPMLFALSVAAGCLTYGETRHKVLSNLIWGKQPEKVIQLSWWARWWTGLKRILRFA